MNILDDVPTELWMEILEFMDDPHDLYNVALTCRDFYSYAIRPLHRNLIWKHPKHVVQDFAFWDLYPQACTEVRTLHLEVCTMPRYNDGVFVNRQGHEYTVHDEDDPANDHLMFIECIDEYYANLVFADDNLFTQIITLIRRFTNLTSFTCKNILLTDPIFGAMYSSGALRSLHIENCVLPPRAPGVEWDHSELPITSLTLLNLRRRVRRHDPHNFHPIHFDGDLEPALKLAQARTLRTLRVDPTADVFGTVFRDPTMTLPPLEFTRLFIERRRIIPNEHHSHYSADYTPPDRHVYRTIMRCPNLNTLVIAQPFGQQTPFPPTNLQNLVNFQGTPEAALAVAHHQTIEGLSILWNETGTRALGAIAALGNPRRNLKLLSIECGTWDFEILIAVTDFFPELRRLRITYQRGGPNEVCPLHICQSFFPSVIQRD